MASKMKLFWTRREARTQIRSVRQRTLVTSILATGLAVLLGLSGAGGTYAWLSASGSTPGATVRSGTLALLINSSSSAVLGNWVVAPTKPVAKSFTVTNTGDAPAVLAAKITATTTPAITANATARVTPVANSAACVPGLSGAAGALNGFTNTAGLGAVAAKATVTMCLEIGLATNTPLSVNGQTLNFTLNISGTQK